MTLKRIKKPCFATLILCLFVVNFMGVGDFFPILLLPYIFKKMLKSKFDKNFAKSFWALLLFSFSFVTFLLFFDFFAASIAGMVGRLLYPALFLVFGYKMINNNKDSVTISKTVFNCLYLVIIFYSAYGVISFLRTMSIYGDMDAVREIYRVRQVRGLWGGFITATSLTTFLSLSLASLPLVFVKHEHLTKCRKIILLVIFILSVYAITETLSRAGIFIVIGSLTANLLFLGKFNTKKLIRIILGSVAAFLISIFYRLNIANIRGFLMEFPLYTRLISDNVESEPRFDAWWATISGLFNYPMGGRRTNLNISFVHNLWLDVAYDTGIIPFILLLIFTIYTLRNIMVFLKTDYPIYLKSIILSMTSAFLIIFMFEPVLQGVTIHFVLYCLMSGIIYKLNYLKNITDINDEIKTVV